MDLDLAHDHTHAVRAEEYVVRDVLEDSFEMSWQRLKDPQNADIWCKPACSKPAAKVNDPLFEGKTFASFSLEQSGVLFVKVGVHTLAPCRLSQNCILVLYHRARQNRHVVQGTIGVLCQVPRH